MNAVAFSPTRPILAVSTAGSGDSRGAVTLWDLTDPTQPQRAGELVGDATDMDEMAFSPDGRTLATTNYGEEIDGSVILWDVADPTRTRRIGSPVTLGTRPVAAGAFHPDGRLLAIIHSAYSSGVDTPASVILWDVSDPTAPRPVSDPLAGEVDAVAFSPDGHTLATGGKDHTLTRWNLQALDALLDNPLERACTITGGGLDEARWTRYINGLPHQDSCTLT